MLKQKTKFFLFYSLILCLFFLTGAGSVQADGKDIGDNCTNNDECASGICHNENYCGCEPMTDAGPPVPEVNCPAGYFCNPESHQCDSLLAEGNECLNDFECATGHCNLELQDPECVECSEQGHCSQGKYCHTFGSNPDYKCQEKESIGGSCSLDGTDFNEICLTGSCSGGTCICTDSSQCPDGQYCDAAVCLEKLNANDACTGDDACKSGLCQDGQCTEPKKSGSGGGGSSGGSAGGEILLDNFMNVEHPAEIIGNVVKYIMGLVGSLALVMFIYGGLLWITSGAKEEKIKKGRDTLIWSGIGLALVMASYIIVKKIIELLGGNL